MNRVISFLKGVGTDNSGRTFDEVLEMSDEALECHHDFIQWLFPLPETSRAVPDSPVLSADDIAIARHDKTIQENLKRALQRMRLFYQKNDHWLQPHDHNHLRITRIIKSLRMLGLPNDAQAFYLFVSEWVALREAPVAKRNQRYWEEAVQ